MRFSFAIHLPSTLRSAGAADAVRGIDAPRLPERSAEPQAPAKLPPPWSQLPQELDQRVRELGEW